METIRIVCAHDCPDMCSLLAEVEGGRVKSIKGDPDQPFTAGFACAKVTRDTDLVHSPERLATPLRRVGAKGEGKFAPISWEDALDEVAERFTRAAQRLGPETVWPFFYAGTMGLVQRDGIERLRHVMRYSRQ